MLVDRVAELTRDTGASLQQKCTDLKDRVLVPDFSYRKFLFTHQDPVTKELEDLQRLSTSPTEKRKFGNKLRTRKREIMQAQDPNLLIQEALQSQKEAELKQLFESALDDVVIVP